MSNHILFNTDTYGKVVQMLSETESKLDSAGKSLKSIDVSREAGGEVSLPSSVVDKVLSFFSIGDTVAEALPILSIRTKLVSTEISRLRKHISEASSLLTDTEKQICIKVNDLEALFNEGRSGSSSAEDDRARAIKQKTDIESWSKILQNDKSSWSNYINEKWLEKAGKVGFIITFFNGTFDDLHPQAVAYQMIQGLLEQYGGVGLNMSIPDLLASITGNATKTSDFSEAVIKLLSKNPTDNEFSDLLNNSEFMKGLKEIQKGSETFEAVGEALSMAYALSNMDPKTVESLRNGLLQNGTPAAKHAAEILSYAGDPTACLVYALGASGSESVVNLAKDLVKTAATKNPVIASIDVGSTIGLTLADTAMGTSETVASAHYTNSMIEVRESSLAAAEKAIEAYNNNPCDETYTAAKEAYEAYNAVSAETVQAYRDTAAHTTDSFIGKITYDGVDMSYLDGVKNNYSSRNSHHESSGN